MTGRTMLLASTALLAALAAAPAHAAPTYALSTTIPVPASASNKAGTFTGYDLSAIDPTTQLYYLTDRSNNAIDVFSSATNTFVTTIGQGLFAGTAGGNNDIAGPNGVSITTLTDGSKLLLAGNTGAATTGNVIAFNLASNGTTVNSTRTISTGVAGTTPVPSNRVDGVAYAPTANTILAANNASNPGYITLINNATSQIIKTVLLNGNGVVANVGANGVEAPIFNTVTGTFFVAVPNLKADASDFGGIIEVDPKTGNVLRTFDFQALGLGGACNPTGLVQGSGGKMGAACGTTGYTVFLDPAANGGAGKLTSSTGVSGGDQIAYDSALDLFYEAARYNPSGPVLGIFSGSGAFLQSLAISTNDHSVAVDPNNGDVLVAFGATTGANGSASFANCAAGCVAVFSPVPEPASLTIVLGGLLGLGAAFRRRAM